MSFRDNFINHPIETLEKALHIRKRIDELNEMLKGLFGPTPPSLAGVQSPSPQPKGKRTVSAASRAKMAAAQKARWSKKSVPSSKAIKAAQVVKPKKGGMSTEGRARIIAAQKARWAKVKTEKSGSAPVKTTAPVKVPAIKGRRTMSPEARAKIAAAQKKRWAKVKIANEGQPKFKII